MLLMSLPLLLQRCIICLTHLTWMICEMEGRRPYSCCFVRYCFQDLFKTAHHILLKFPSSFSLCVLFSIHVVHPYSIIDTATTWKKSHFILLNWSNFHMIDNMSLAFNAFTRSMLTSPSVDEILLLRYANWSTNFRGLPFRVEMAPFYLKHMCSVLFQFI